MAHHRKEQPPTAVLIEACRLYAEADAEVDRYLRASLDGGPPIRVLRNFYEAERRLKRLCRLFTRGAASPARRQPPELNDDGGNHES